jgi:hypothetical protein
MAYQRRGPGDKGQNLFGSIITNSLTVGGGAITEIARGTFTVNTSSVAQFARETGTFTLSGATTGDLVLCAASSSLNAGLILEAVGICFATSEVTVGFVNHSSAAVVQTSGLSNHYVHLKLA